MSVVPLGTQVVYKSSPAFSVPGDKPEITPAVLPTFIQLVRDRVLFPPEGGGGSSTQAWMPTYVSILRFLQMI
jgi:hypothetical protein